MKHVLMERLYITLAVAAFAAAPGVSLAQQGGGTPEDRKACSASVQRYCTAVVQGGDFAILACLQQNRSRIAPACQQVLIKYGQ